MSYYELPDFKRIVAEPMWALVHFPQDSVEYIFAARLYTELHNGGRALLAAQNRHPVSSPLQAPCSITPRSNLGVAAAREVAIPPPAEVLPSTPVVDDRPSKDSDLTSIPVTVKEGAATVKKRAHMLDEVGIGIASCPISKFPFPGWMKTPNVICGINMENILEHFPNADVGKGCEIMTSRDFSPNEYGLYTGAYFLSFTPPLGKHHLPKNEYEKCAIVHFIAEAILNCGSIQDNEDGRVIASRWQRGQIPPFERWQVEVIARIILEAALKIHIHGFREPIFDRLLRDKLNPGLTFDERINALLVLFSKWKAVCDTVMKNEKIMAFVAGPIAYFKISSINQRNNNARKKSTEKLRAESQLLSKQNVPIETVTPPIHDLAKPAGLPGQSSPFSPPLPVVPQKRPASEPSSASNAKHPALSSHGRRGRSLLSRAPIEKPGEKSYASSLAQRQQKSSQESHGSHSKNKRSSSTILAPKSTNFPPNKFEDMAMPGKGATGLPPVGKFAVPKVQANTPSPTRSDSKSANDRGGAEVSEVAQSGSGSGPKSVNAPDDCS